MNSHSFHCILRKSFRWYHNWHNHPFHQDIHWLVFILIAISVTSSVLQANTRFVYSSESSNLYLAQNNGTNQDSDLIPANQIPFSPAQAPTLQNPQAGQDLGLLVNNFFNYALLVVGICVFVMIMWGGILWVTSAAHPGNIATAKSKIFHAIIGAVILLSAYVILNTINPELVKGSLTLPGIQAPAPGPIQLPDQPPTGTIDACSSCSVYPGGKTAGGQAIQCTGLYVNTNQPLNSSARTCPYADVLVAQNLVTLRGLNRDWLLSEGFPPTVNHTDSCHGNGSCVDIALSPRPSDNAQTIQALLNLCTAARQAGFTTIINEYTSLVSAWPSGPNNCPPPRSTPLQTGDHLHLQR